ncbi:hypothetical protein [Endozoicomonas lisbonensis]|uniref:hypothetical protein n=1 Tax=Endozoicomonas lisbonensis TaxID=3120522 RepID=UPI0033943844
MARPGVPEERYQEAFAAFIAEGRRPQDINPSMLQNAVGGGRYERAANFLEQLRSQHVEEQEALIQVPVKPEWFENFVNQLTELVADASNAQWAPLSEGIQQKINEETHKSDLQVKEAQASKELANNLYQDAKKSSGKFETELEVMEEVLQGVRDELAQTINELSAEKAKSEQLDKQSTQLKEEKISLEASLKAETTKAAQMEGFYNKANTEAEMLRDQLRTKEAQLQEEAKKLVAAQKDMDAADKARQDAEDQTRDALHEKNQSEKTMAATVASLQASLESEEKHSAAKDESIQQLKTESDQAKEKAAGLEREVEIANTSHQEQAAKISKLELELDKNRTVCSDLKAELNFLKSQEQLKLVSEQVDSEDAETSPSGKGKGSTAKKAKEPEVFSENCPDCNKEIVGYNKKHFRQMKKDHETMCKGSK